MLGLDNPIHLLFLLVLLLLVFGAKRLPEMGRSLGSGMRGFKDSLSGEVSHNAALASPGSPCRARRPHGEEQFRLPATAVRASRSREPEETPWPSPSAGSATRIASASSITSRSCARG